MHTRTSLTTVAISTGQHHTSNTPVFVIAVVAILVVAIVGVALKRRS